MCPVVLNTDAEPAIVAVSNSNASDSFQILSLDREVYMAEKVSVTSFTGATWHRHLTLCLHELTTDDLVDAEDESEHG